MKMEIKISNFTANKLVMNSRKTLIRYTFIFGVIALLIGVVDPLEGSLLICIGSISLTVSTYLNKDPQWKVFLTASIMIITGVCFLFYLSSLGGFGGSSSLSWWWSVLIAPYPLGWLLSVIMLIFKLIKKTS